MNILMIDWRTYLLKKLLNDIILLLCSDQAEVFMLGNTEVYVHLASAKKIPKLFYISILLKKGNEDKWSTL